MGAEYFVPYSLPAVRPERREPANGAAALRDTYHSLREALPQITYYAGTEKLKVFMPRLPGHEFSETKDVLDAKVVVSGEDNEQAIVIHPSPNEYLIVGFRCQAELLSEVFAWPALQKVHVERGRFDGLVWKALGEPSEYGVNLTQKEFYVGLDAV